MSGLITPFGSAVSAKNNKHLDQIGSKFCDFLKDTCGIQATHEIARDETSKRMLIVTVDDRLASTFKVVDALKQIEKRGFHMGDVVVAGPDGEINCLYSASPRPH